MREMKWIVEKMVGMRHSFTIYNRLNIFFHFFGYFYKIYRHSDTGAKYVNFIELVHRRKKKCEHYSISIC